MSGILNNKQRFVDTVLTQEGRRQIASGELRVEFATFTDGGIFYGKDAVSGTIDQSDLIQLEASPDLPTDIITMESNLFGEVMASIIPGVNSTELLAGQIVEYKTENSGSKNVITGSEYRALVDGILSSSIGNFARLQTIGTLDPLMDDPTFKVSTNIINFDVTDDNLDSLSALPNANINVAESIPEDRHLSHVPNFKYMPPRNTPTSTEPTGSLLYKYPNPSQVDIQTYADIKRELSFLPHGEVIFQNTSRGNNLICQVFETSGDSFSKLKIIDFGEFDTGEREHPTRRIFFMGKEIQNKDITGNKTYVNMFTVEFD
jgi:hypothetical protein